MRPAYYNEIEPFAAEWLRNLIAAGHLPAGDVDTRSIVDVAADDLVGYGQCHFFAGIGGWAFAARVAGWPDDRELWTGSCPCQPFSVAGKGAGADDERHLWPHYFRLIRARRPAVAMGEQVAAAVGKAWLDGVLTDLEGIGYTGRAVVVPACAVDAPHRRDRLWFVADANGFGGQVDQNAGGCSNGSGAREVSGLGGARDVHVADASGGRCGEPGARQVQQPGRAEAVGGGEAGTVAVTRGDGHDPANLDAAEPRRDRQDDGLSVGSGGELRGSAWYGDVADADTPRPLPRSYDGVHSGQEGSRARDVESVRHRSAWDGAGWIIGHDGKARRVGTRIRRVVDGLSVGMVGVRPDGDAEEVEMIPLLERGAVARVGKLRAFGNAIVPQVAAEVIGAYMDCMPEAT